MKKIFGCRLKLGLLIAVIAGMWACDNLHNTYKEFLGDGERIYVGKIDSLNVFGGYQRVQVWGLLQYSKTASEIVIRWDDKEIVESLQGLTKDDTLRINIGDLAEGNIKFTVFTRDSEGNASVIQEVFTDVYGDIYASMQSSRSISQINIKGFDVEIVWNPAEYGIVDAVMTYMDEDNVEQTVVVNNDDEATTLDSWLSGSAIKVIARYFPTATALDTLTLNPVEYRLPKLEGEFLLDGSVFGRPQDPFIASDGYGGAYGNLFDGNEGTFIHTQDGVGVPNHYSYDMHKAMNLSRGRVVVRYGEAGDGWSFTEAQLWGHPGVGEPSEIFPSIADNFNNKDIWEGDAESKGWVKIADITRNPAVHGAVVEFPINKEVKVRYMLWRTVQVVGAPTEGTGAYSCVKELYLWQTFD